MPDLPLDAIVDSGDPLAGFDHYAREVIKLRRADPKMSIVKMAESLGASRTTISQRMKDPRLLAFLAGDRGPQPEDKLSTLKARAYERLEGMLESEDSRTVEAAVKMLIGDDLKKKSVASADELETMPEEDLLKREAALNRKLEGRE